jgi:outer membrane protein assembly factor BamB
LGGNAYALSAATGTVLWHVRSPGTVLNPGTLFTPVVANGILYAGVGSGTTQARLEALRATTGRLLWRSPVIGLDQTSPAVAGGLVYIGDAFGFVRAFHATTGAQAWQFATPHGVEATPVVANGVVYDSASEVSGTLYALNATTGHKLASFPLGTATISPAVVAGGTAYIGGFDQRLHAYALPKP